MSSQNPDSFQNLGHLDNPEETAPQKMAFGGYRSEKEKSHFDTAPPEAAPTGKTGFDQNMTDHQNRIGFINIDGLKLENAFCDAIILPDHANSFVREMYVDIFDRPQQKEFLGRIVEGPFHAARDLNREDTPELIRDVQTDLEEQPAYYIHGVVEVLGELIDGERLIPTTTRPRPFSEIVIFPDIRLRRLLGIEGDLYVGVLNGYGGVKVHTQSANKSFLPRNVGIFGTVGSGKSNTVQVLLEEATRAGWAVVVIDVEGEYVRMNEPTDDLHLARILKSSYGLEPSGIEDFHVYVPSSGRSEAITATPFKVPISGLQPEVVADILDFTEAELRVYMAITSQATKQNTTQKLTPEQRNPYAPVASAPAQRPYDLQDLVDGLIEGSTGQGYSSIRLLPNVKQHDITTAATLRSKLVHLGRSDMLDWNATNSIAEVPLEELLVGGRVSVLDVSETDDRSRNIAIAYMLQGLFDIVISTPRGELLKTGVPRPPIMLVIEEVHTFVSRATAPRMRAVLDSLQIISRRGRKRWMSLALISQQPGHVPDELFELTNTRVIHQMKSMSNLAPVKATTGGVEETLWTSVPALGPGQCLLTGPVFKNPLFVNVRPARSRRLLIT